MTASTCIGGRLPSFMRGSETARLSLATVLARCSATDAASYSMAVDRGPPECCGGWRSGLKGQGRGRNYMPVSGRVPGQRIDEADQMADL